MAEELTFSGMTWELLEEKYGMVLQESRLFSACAPVEPSPVLVENLRRARQVRLFNERARAHRLVDPVLAELETFYDGKISTIPEMYLEVREVEGLSGNPDFVVSAGTLARVIPIVAIVEAKKDDIDGGLPQCAAELYAAYLFDKGSLPRVFGCVTNGMEWRFLSFEGTPKRVTVDRLTYLINDLSPLLGVLRHVVDVSLAALEGR